MTWLAANEGSGRSDGAAALGLLTSAEGGALSGGPGVCEGLAMSAASTRGWGEVGW